MLFWSVKFYKRRFLKFKIFFLLDFKEMDYIKILVVFKIK